MKWEGLGVELSNRFVRSWHPGQIKMAEDGPSFPSWTQLYEGLRARTMSNTHSHQLA